MRRRLFTETITVKISKEQRAAIETMADQNELSIGQAVRDLMDLGIKARAGAEV